MSIESRIVRTLIAWLYRHYPYQVLDIVVGKGRHIQRNPRRAK